jgi:hypothetical protein
VAVATTVSVDVLVAGGGTSVAGLVADGVSMVVAVGAAVSVAVAAGTSVGALPGTDAAPLRANSWSTEVRLEPLPAQGDPAASAYAPAGGLTKSGSAVMLPVSVTLPERLPVRCRQLSVKLVVPPPVGR